MPVTVYVANRDEKPLWVNNFKLVTEVTMDFCWASNIYTEKTSFKLFECWSTEYLYFFFIMITDVVSLMQQNMLFLCLAEVLSYIGIPVVKSEVKPQLTG